MAPRPIVPAQLTRRPFTVAEAERAGLSRRQLRGKSWKRVGIGLYAWIGLATDPVLELAAILCRLPAEAAFSGRTAAWLHGLDLPPCDPVEATIPIGGGVSGRVGLVVRRVALGNGDVVERRGLRVTSGLRTAAELGSRSDLVEAVVAVDMALRKRMVDLAELREYAIAHGRRRGIANLRRAIDLAEPATESAMETRLRLLLVLNGLPRPQTQVRIHDGHGRFLGQPDLYYPVQRLGLEYDGGTHRDSLVEDNRRQNRLLNAGVRLLRFTAADVHRDPDAIVAQVRAALAAA
jgi:very-short-patch-repair endonuclease